MKKENLMETMLIWAGEHPVISSLLAIVVFGSIVEIVRAVAK